MKIIIKLSISLLLLLIIIKSNAQQVIKTKDGLITGTYTVWTNRLDHKIMKPFIICEGFDPLGDQTTQIVYNQVNNGNNILLNKLREKNFDIIILNLDFNKLDIEKNAELFIALVNDINAQLQTNKSNYQLNVLGVSMGGLIIRYALAKMEHDGINHRVERYISFDSPHLGANIPLGIQQMLHTYLGPLALTEEWLTLLNTLQLNEFTDKIGNASKSLFGGIITDAVNAVDGAEKISNFSAAFQMSANLLVSNVWRTKFLTNLSLVGSYPKKCRNIAVSMGANNINQNLAKGECILEMNTSTKLVDMSVNYPFKLGTYPWTWTPFDISNKVYAMSGDVIGRTFFADIKIQDYVNTPKKSLPFALFNYQHDKLVAPSNCNIDHVAGAYYDVQKIFNFGDWGNKEITIPVKYEKTFCSRRVPFVGRICKSVSIDFDITCKRNSILNEFKVLPKSFCFVPTISALAINNADWNADILSIINNYPYSTNKSITPFDVVCFSKYNHFHAEMPSYDDNLGYDNEVANVLFDELIPENLYIQNKTFDNTYKNVFEASSIIIGKNVDPNTKRSAIQGNVTSEAGSHVRYRADKSVTLMPGCLLNGYANLTATGSPEAIVSTAKSFKETETILPKNEVASIVNTINEVQSLEPKITQTGEKKMTVTITNDNQNETGSISENISCKITNTDIKVFPNPISQNSKLLLEIANKTRVDVTIISTQGVLIKNVVNNVYSPGFYTVSLDLANIPHGIYICNIKYDNIVKSLQVIID